MGVSSTRERVGQIDLVLFEVVRGLEEECVDLTDRVGQEETSAGRSVVAGGGSWRLEGQRPQVGLVLKTRPATTPAINVYSGQGFQTGSSTISGTVLGLVLLAREVSSSLLEQIPCCAARAGRT